MACGVMQCMAVVMGRENGVWSRELQAEGDG
eukprot:CAMPEP_0175931578 /NCGR_PEP_ID=MMETSP0108-20121206/18924_1 /TAXON_ID=195067 ORGANISM="Goniomonas pacifica, Strain CCMP1869" /NCGR_SAMPLE_ID=MMETSP0108 /ASSEMBLY_ACC=CAM_ASM_000204 /LENGTH=30 /DNA_ID= /DNA_START= /DNA_END= /DNA_ORIENTATION=